MIDPVINYGVPIAYFTLTTQLAAYSKKNEIALNKDYIKMYNICLSSVSLIILLNCSIRASNYSLADVLCYTYVENIEIERYTFLFLKIVEWMDTVLLIIKNKGDMKKISNLHYYHHAFVPTLVYNGLYQPGEIYVLISNSLAHFLMYFYYAFPRELKNIKFSITLYQYIQHLFAVMLMVKQRTNGCNINYPLITVIGYVYFFYEYLLIILDHMKITLK